MILANTTTIINGHPVRLVDNGDGTYSFEVVTRARRSDSMARVSDTVVIGTGAAHSALDVVSTDLGEMLQFDCSDIMDAGGGGMINDSVVTLNQSSVFSGGAGYYLYLWRQAATVQPDNEAFSLSDLDNYIGRIEISTLEDLGANCVAQDTGHGLIFELGAASTILYGKLVCKGAETTVNAAIITISLGIAV